MADTQERGVDIFVVELHHNLGNYIVETDLDKSSLDQTVKGLMDGQFFQPAKVYRLVDVTAEFQEKCQDEINRSERGIIPEHLDWFMAP